ncbi:DNA-binding transcriptional regulator [Photobacterium sp. BZF1]|uniref:helix-turn-helix domain-containing protein n=1 Tax=Photobacterium sp. BZF1 TaxID=1904457 RepID=UPI001CA4310C|nr:helix-turn-helix domain-containing protein [Photobacterium sp. BZF1]
MDNTEIRNLRNRLQLSVAEFAGILSVSKDTLYSWELGRRVPMGLTKKVLKLIAEDQDIYKKFVHMTEVEREQKRR